MRTYLICGTGITKREAWWDTVPWAEKPLSHLSWDIHQRDTTDSLVEEAAGIAGVNGWAILLRGYHDAGFRSAALKASILNYAGPLAIGTFPTLLPWVDTGALSSIAKDAAGREVAFDFGNDAHLEAFCADFLMPFWAQFPEGGRIRHERSTRGRRLITWWGIKPDMGRGVVNQPQCQRLLDRIGQRMVAAGLGEPDHLVDQTWLTYAPGLDVHAVHSWFNPNLGAPGAFSITRHNGITTGCACPGFHVQNYPPVVPRNGGDTLRNALKAFRDQRCDYVLLEGHTDDTESAGFYRSSAWAPATRELDSIREHILMADPQPKAKGIRFEGKFAGIDPEKPTVVYADRDTIGTWEAVELIDRGAFKIVRFIAANRVLGVDDWALFSLPADTQSRLARFTLNGTVLEPARLALTVEEGVIANPVPPVEPPPVQPPAPTRLPITQIAGVDFLDKNGRRRVLNGVDAFVAYRKFLDGGAAALKPFFDESLRLKFDMWRVFMTGSLAQNGYIGINPKEPGYYEKVRPFADELNAHGILLLACAYVDNQDVKAGLDHWKRLGDLLGGSYCLLSGGNEFQKNGWNPAELTAPASGIWWSRGSSTSNPDPFVPRADGARFIEFHPTRAMPTMMYDASASPTNLVWVAKQHVPLIIDEPIGFAIKDDPNKRSADPKLAWQLARIYSALCAGACFHNDESQRGLLMTGNILKCAEAWQDGMRID